MVFSLYCVHVSIYSYIYIYRTFQMVYFKVHKMNTQIIDVYVFICIHVQCNIIQTSMICCTVHQKCFHFYERHKLPSTARGGLEVWRRRKGKTRDLHGRHSSQSFLQDRTIYEVQLALVGVLMPCNSYILALLPYLLSTTAVEVTLSNILMAPNTELLDRLLNLYSIMSPENDCQ